MKKNVSNAKPGQERRPGKRLPKKRPEIPGAGAIEARHEGTRHEDAEREAHRRGESFGDHPEPADNDERFRDEVPLLCGIKPVLELLERDASQVDTVWLRRGRPSPERNRLLDRCREAKVRFVLTDEAALSRLCADRGSHQVQHQGVVARLFSSGFVAFSSLLETGRTTPFPLILALDQVQDPGNAGTLARTLYALGGAGLLVPQHEGVYLGAGARRAAAGALERLPVARVTNLSRALREAREQGWTVYGAAAGEEGLNAFAASFCLPAVLVLGSEEKGIRPGVLKACDAMVRIPMCRMFDSLNVAQAGAMLMASLARTLPAFTAS